MKKFLLLVLCAVSLTMCLTACGDSSSTADISLSEQQKTDLLKTANSNAKLVFTTANNYAADFIADGKIVDKLDYTGPVDELPDSNSLSKPIQTALEEVCGDDCGYICIKFDPSAEDGNFAQWSEKESGSPVGQYPNPPKAYDDAMKIEFGKKA